MSGSFVFSEKSAREIARMVRRVQRQPAANLGGVPTSVTPRSPATSVVKVDTSGGPTGAHDVTLYGVPSIWAPGNHSVLQVRVVSTIVVNVDGLVAATGGGFVVIAVPPDSPGALTLTNLSSRLAKGSGKQFSFTSGDDYIVRPGTSIGLWYDTVNLVWKADDDTGHTVPRLTFPATIQTWDGSNNVWLDDIDVLFSECNGLYPADGNYVATCLSYDTPNDLAVFVARYTPEKTRWVKYTIDHMDIGEAVGIGPATAAIIVGIPPAILQDAIILATTPAVIIGDTYNVSVGETSNPTHYGPYDAVAASATPYNSGPISNTDYALGSGDPFVINFDGGIGSLISATAGVVVVWLLITELP